MIRFFLIFLIIFSISGIFIWQYFYFNDGKLHVVFCDVGQGDAIFIRTPNKTDILVDGGPGDTVIACLSENMPFWDRKIELVILTHPHLDHLEGLIEVFKRYKVISFATEKVENDTIAYRVLEDEIKKENIETRYLYRGDRFSFSDGVVLNILGPSREFLYGTSPGGMIRESGEFGNIISLLRYKDFSILLTGDSQVAGLRDALEDRQLDDLDVIQVPHHGSKTGIDREILDIVSPELAIISVGKNSYGHPAIKILELLKDENIKTLRTDRIGNIEIVTDGEDWVVKN